MDKKEVFLVVGLIALALIVGIFLGRTKDTPDRDVAILSAEQLQGNQSFAQFDYEAYVQKILKERPNDPKTFAEIGDIYFGQHMFYDAIEYYNKAVTLNPQDIDSYNDLGLAYHYTGRSDEGLRYVEEGIKRNPVYQRIWLTKGFILAIKGGISDARVAWEKAYSIDPNSEVGRSAASFLEEYKPTTAQ